MAAARDPITTHVLDSTTGRPAASISATLTLLNGDTNAPSFTAKTSAVDGRISHWETQGSQTLADIFKGLTRNSTTQPMTWSLRFETGDYWGKENTFYPEVEIRFFVRKDEAHYHVPVLLGPWSYTTYRGS